MAIRTGRVTLLTIFVALILIAWWAMRKFSRTGNLPIRRLAGLDAIDEAVGRITEMGRPAAFVQGTGVMDAQTFAAFEILKYTAEQVAKHDARMIVCNPLPEIQPISEEIVRAAYRQVGREESYNPDDVRYLADTSLRAAVLGIFQREKVAATFLFGNYYHESVIFSEAGNVVGALQISGTANTHQLPFFVACCDYTLIGEEIFAAGAYLSRNPAQVGSLVAQEGAKFFAVAIIIIGAILATVGNKSLANLLKK